MPQQVDSITAQSKTPPCSFANHWSMLVGAGRL